MQDYPGAPGTARPGNPGTAVPAACGGAAVLPLPPAPDPHRSCATPLPLPMAPDRTRSRATSLPQASGHVRPGAMSMASPGHADAGGGPASASPSVPLPTAPVPAHASRLLQGVLRRVTATPLALTDRLSHRLNRHSSASGHPRPPVATGGPPGGYALATHAPIHLVPPVIRVPTRPQPATAATGFLRQRQSRAPPRAVRRKTYSCQPMAPRYAWLRQTPPLRSLLRGRVREGVLTPDPWPIVRESRWKSPARLPSQDAAPSNSRPARIASANSIVLTPSSSVAAGSVTGRSSLMQSRKKRA